MENSRLKFHNILIDVLGNKHVYFQPPESQKLNYPCIRYSLSNIPTKKADNKSYMRDYSYDVTLVHTNPDNHTVDRLLDLPYSKFNKSYVVQGLYHYNFTIIYKNEKETI